MPKRIATPPPGDDEPRYLTVVYPYAIHGTCNMELPRDRQDFARWVACCIDKDAFFAVFHKPSSRGMVIIEVNKDYPHFDRILGEHRWSEFLHKPTEEEKARVTQVFYCTYNTGRIVQKNGWKRIDVNEAWFKSWSPNNRIIKCPYPPTHFCDVPVEDRTNHSLCRPLPGAVKLTPVEDIVAPVPVVGSPAWIQTKGGPSPAPIVEQSKPKSAWDKGAPKMLAALVQPGPTANGSAKRTVGIPQAANTGARMPAIGGGPITVKSNNVWKSKLKPAPHPVPTTWEESALVSREATPVSRGVSPGTAQAPAAPQGFPAGKDVWECGATSYPIHPPGIVVPNKGPAPTAQGVPDRTSSLSTSCWDSTGASTSSPDSESGPDLTTATESDNPYAVHIHFSESLEEEFHGMRIRPIDDGDLRELDSIAPGEWDEPTAGAWETTNNGWDNEPMEAQDLWVQNQESAKKPMLCSAHGVVCKKGICAEYAKQVRLAKRAEEAEKRKVEFANRGKKGKGRGKGRGAAWRKNEDEDDDDEGERRVRRPTQNNAFRGPGAPVKTNWRGTPRAIISPDAIEERETSKAADDVDHDGWGNSDSQVGPNMAAVSVGPAVVGGAADGAAETASEASWGMSENAFDPWAPKATAQPVAKANQTGRGKPQGNKKKLAAPQAQTKVSSSWADQVDAELNGTAGDDSDRFSAVSSKRGSKRGGSSTAGRGASDGKSSTGGWGSVANNNMPW